VLYYVSATTNRSREKQVCFNTGRLPDVRDHAQRDRGRLFNLPGEDDRVLLGVPGLKCIDCKACMDVTKLPNGKLVSNCSIWPLHDLILAHGLKYDALLEWHCGDLFDGDRLKSAYSSPYGWKPLEIRGEQA
jgi:hypothetical protein